MKITSYNILANNYIKEDRYPKVPAHLLQWEHRRDHLLQKISSFDADLICLQEVEIEAYQLIHSLLTKKGYHGIYTRRGQGRLDGCATFSLFPIHQHITIHYHDQVRTISSGNLALITIVAVDHRLVAIVNTHIKWDPPDTLPQDLVGLRQVRELISHHIRLDTSVDHWILCGDFNAEPHGVVIQELLRAGFKYPLEDQLLTYYGENYCSQIDFILCQNDAQISPLSRPTYSLDTTLPNEKEPSDHLPVSALITFSSSDLPCQ